MVLAMIALADNESDLGLAFSLRLGDSGFSPVDSLERGQVEPDLSGDSSTYPL